MDRAIKLSAGLRLILRAWDLGGMSEESMCRWLESFYGGES